MMQPVFRAFLAGIFLLAWLGQTQTTDKPNFSGRWRMMKEKSDFAGLKPPDVITRSIDQRGVIMNVHTVETMGQKTSIADVSYSTDGAITQNVISGRNAESRTFWDGPTLVVKTTMRTSKGDPELIEDRWSLSDDKQVLTIASHIETDKGGADLKLVCGREQR
jgi:hypothetical protein